MQEKPDPVPIRPSRTGYKMRTTIEGGGEPGSHLKMHPQGQGEMVLLHFFYIRGLMAEID